jgi:hypothetical protein
VPIVEHLRANGVGEQDGEGLPAAGPCLPVAAKDPPGAEGLTLGMVLVEAEQTAVPNESANHLAVRTGGLFAPFDNGVPFLGVTVKPGLRGHAVFSAKKVILRERGEPGLRGTKRNPEAGCGVKLLGRFAKLSG